MKKGNLIILAGSKRAGKTTVSNYLQKLGYVTLNFDYLLDAYDNSLKEHTKEMEFSFFNNLVNYYYNNTINYGQNIVFDIYDFSPSKLKELDKFSNINLFILGYPKASIEEIEDCLITYGEEFEWNKQLNQDEIETKAKEIYNYNQILQKECEQEKIILFDDGTKNERQQNLQKLVEIITKLG